jgi:MFS family permease
MILPLALAQFIASYAATSMNVAIGSIAKDLGTTVAGVQTAITLFTLTMAALMIPGSKLTDIWGRKRCFVAGLIVYGIGALLASLAPGIAAMIVGYSLLEGVGSALMIPPIYILITVAFPDVTSRARYFGVVSGAGGLGAAAGPLIGGLITSAISWRAAFGLQVLVVAWITVLARRITDPARPGRTPRFDLTGAVLSAAGLFFVVLGVLQSRTYGFFVSRQDFSVGGTVVIPKGWISPVWLFVGVGALFLLWFFLHVRSAERKHRDVLLALRLFRNRVANLALGTQMIQWLVLQGSFFVISVYLQEVDGYNAIKTGLLLTPATIGILAASAAADRLAKRHSQRSLIIVGFFITVVGTALLLALVRAHAGILRWIPGLLLTGVGIGIMLTSSVNVVQSSFPDRDQGDISGLSRSLSNLGSSFGTALVGSILVAVKLPAGKPYAVALTVLGVITLIGLVLAVLIPRQQPDVAGGGLSSPVVRGLARGCRGGPGPGRPCAAQLRPAPGRYALDLDLQREAQERPDQHDEPEDQDVLQGRGHGDGPDQVGGDEDLQAQQQRAPEGPAQRRVASGRLVGAAPRHDGHRQRPQNADDEDQRAQRLEGLGNVFHHPGEGHRLSTGIVRRRHQQHVSPGCRPGRCQAACCLSTPRPAAGTSRRIERGGRGQDGGTRGQSGFRRRSRAKYHRENHRPTTFMVSMPPPNSSRPTQIRTAGISGIQIGASTHHHDKWMTPPSLSPMSRSGMVLTTSRIRGRRTVSRDRCD